ncbi:beta-propeller domain-containing protein [Actinomadura meridiana]
MRLVAYDGCDALLDGLRQATAEKVGPYGLSDMPLGLAEDGMSRGKVPQAAPVPGGAPEHSTTNSHEPGADEPDLVKTDGRRIVTLTDGRLRVIDPVTRKVVHTLDIPGAQRRGIGQLLLSGDRVLVLSESWPLVSLPRRAMPGKVRPWPHPARPTTRLTLVDLSGTPKVIGNLTTESDYLDARQSGSTVRVVVRNRPDIDFPGHGADPKKAVQENKAAAMKAPLGAWLPEFQVDAGNGGPAKKYTPPCDQVSRPASYTGSAMLSMLTLDLSRGLGDPQAIAVTADGATVYGNGKSLYVTGTPPRPFLWKEPSKAIEQKTDVYKFDVSGKGRPRYVASGSVKGDLLNQYSMSEYGGNLRVATTVGRFGADRERSESSVHVLAQDGARLGEIGRVDGLGKGERIYSVRFIGAAAYVVTFRQVDPLYVLDLKDPRRPRLTGELKITGYSAYLHPMADGKLLGVGRDADTSGRTRGLQVSLFDVSGQPRKVASYQVKGASSQAEFEPHAFLYWPRSGLTVIPVDRPGGGTNDALALKVSGTSISEIGTVKHPGRAYTGGVQRSVIVGGTLWTFSEDGARATDAATLRSAAWVPFG